MKTKNLLTIFLAAVLLFSLFSCGDTSEDIEGEFREVDDLLKVKPGKEFLEEYLKTSKDEKDSEDFDPAAGCFHDILITDSTAEYHVTICGRCNTEMGEREEHVLKDPVRLPVWVNGERVFVYYRVCGICEKTVDHILSKNNDLTFE